MNIRKIFSGPTPFMKEFRRLEQQEQRLLQKKLKKKETKLDQLLADKVPEKLQQTLQAAFEKAFGLVFEKGPGVIEKTYRREEMEKNYQIREFAASVKQDKKTLRAFSKQAGQSGTLNQALSAAAGIGMGLVGVGLPDIPLLTGWILKSVYEIALSYGFDYDCEGEKYYILLLIRGAVSGGEQIGQVEEAIDAYRNTGLLPADYNQNEQVKKTADVLSANLLYMKFLQGIPVVGAVGGAYDAVLVHQVSEYAELKYRRRFYEQLKAKEKRHD